MRKEHRLKTFHLWRWQLQTGCSPGKFWFVWAPSTERQKRTQVGPLRDVVDRHT